MFATQPSFPAPAARRRRRCFASQQSNNEDCMHCYGCGSNEHFLAGCRMRGARQFRGNPLNGQGSLQRDREWLVPQHCPSTVPTVREKVIKQNLNNVHHAKKCFTVLSPARLNIGLFIKIIVHKRHVRHSGPRHQNKRHNWKWLR